MIEITGYPRLIIAKPSTPGATWPDECPASFFDSLNNSEVSSKYIGRSGENPMLDDHYRYPYLVEISLVSGLSESLTSSWLPARDQLVNRGSKEISGPTLATGFGGTDDGDGTIFGVATKTIIDYTSTISLNVDEGSTDTSIIEFGNVGNFGLGDTLKTSSDLEKYPNCPDCLLGEPGWKLTSERVNGFRHLLAPTNSSVRDALDHLCVTSPLALAANRLMASSGALTFYSQLIYRYMPRTQSAFYFDNASSLSRMDSMLNGGDMGWAGDTYDYNPDYDDCD